MKKRVLFVCGGLSGEHEISLISTKHVLKALDRQIFEALILYVGKDGAMSLVDETVLFGLSDNPKEVKGLGGNPADFRPYSFSGKKPGVFCQSKFYELDVVFPLIHGIGGEDGKIQGLFETAGLPIVGSGVKASAICMDKAITKKLCFGSGLPVVDFLEIFSEAELPKVKSFPCFVKPAEEGSSLGVHKVNSARELPAAVQDAFRYGRKILVEPAIDGRELEIAVLDTADGRVVSPAGEIVCSTGFYSYEAKYVDPHAARLIAPAELKPEELQEIQDIASKVFDCLECRSMARIDFFMRKSDGKFLLNEVNTIPGFTPISMYPRLLGLAGVSYTQLVSRLIQSAN